MAPGFTDDARTIQVYADTSVHGGYLDAPLEVVWMSKAKRFDCVEMKWEIQQRITEQLKDLPREKARQEKRKQIEEGPVLGPFLKKVGQASRKRTEPGSEQG